jgi:hypothetical protein
MYPYCTRVILAGSIHRSENNVSIEDAKMVRVIENQIPGRSQVFEFKVYKTKARQRIFGYLKPYGIVEGSTATWVKTDFGVDVGEAFRTAMELADQHHIPFIYINDPNGLFPPDQR